MPAVRSPMLRLAIFALSLARGEAAFAAQQTAALLGEREARRCGDWELRRRTRLQRSLWRRLRSLFRGHASSLVDEAEGPQDDLGNEQYATRSQAT